MQCTNCKSEILATAKFCPECGSKVENLGKTCPNKECNRTDLPEEALFCPDCGTKLTSGFESFTETVNGVSFDMVAVKGGTFAMGSNDGDSDEKPIHTVTVSDFAMGKTEVTQALWQAVMGSNPSEFKGKDLPVENVSWDDCNAFVAKLNRLTGKTYRLPTEAEWEYAAGGGATNRTKWAGTDSESSLGSYAWFAYNSSSKTHAVATKQPNALGLYDMSGNVWEWCSDWCASYGSDSQTNPTGAATVTYRVLRGGSWDRNASSCRVADRSSGSPGFSYSDLGFRLVLGSPGW